MKTPLLISIIILSLLLAIIIIFFFVKLFFYNKKIKTFENLKKELVIDKIYSIDKTLIRVTDIAKANEKFKNIAIRLNSFHDKLWVIYNRVDKLINDLKKEVHSKSKKSYKKSFLIMGEIKEKNNEFKKIHKEFRSLSIQFTYQDEYIRNEFQFYQKNLRKATNLYTHKRILLDKISPQIDSFRIRIKNIEKAFEDAIDVIDVEKVDNILRKYSNLVIQFTKLINEGPSIFVKIYKEIPEMAKNLKDEYIEKKKQINAPLEHIDFLNSLKEISKVHQKAKNSFIKLDIEKTKTHIKNTLKSFKTLQKMINLEIKSRNLFLRMNSETIIEIKKIFNHYVSIKKQFKEILGKGEKMPQESFEKYNEIKKIARDIDIKAIKYKDLIKERTLSYSAKLSRTRSILQDILQMNLEMNEFIELIWSINLDDAIYKNKFKRSEAAINELISNLKQENIQLSDDEKKEFEKLIIKKTELLSSVFEKRITNSTSEKIDDFSSKATNFYMILNGKIQIAIHIKNMLKELANKRSSNERLNLMLQMAEKDFLDGKYASSLNAIIDFVKDENIFNNYK